MQSPFSASHVQHAASVSASLPSTTLRSRAPVGGCLGQRKCGCSIYSPFRSMCFPLASVWVGMHLTTHPPGSFPRVRASPAFAMAPSWVTQMPILPGLWSALLQAATEPSRPQKMLRIGEIFGRPLLGSYFSLSDNRCSCSGTIPVCGGSINGKLMLVAVSLVVVVARLPKCRRRD
jgi:hypothetical protein